MSNSRHLLLSSLYIVALMSGNKPTFADIANPPPAKKPSSNMSTDGALSALNTLASGSSKSDSKASKRAIKILRELMAQPNEEQLAKLKSKLPDIFLVRALSRLRSYQLHTNGAEKKLLETFPKSVEDLSYFYNALDPANNVGNTGGAPLSKMYYDFYTTIGNLVKTDPSHLPQLFRILSGFNKLDNADEWPMLCEISSAIYKKASKEYLLAVQTVEPEFRDRALACRTPPDVP